MSAQSVQREPPVRTLEFDLAAATLVRREWHESEGKRGAEYLVATVPSATGQERYWVSGHSHGRDAACTCWGFRRWKRCKHVAQFILIWEQLERRHYGQPCYTDRHLIKLLAFFDAQSDRLDHEQRLRRGGIRAALRDRGIDPDAARTEAARLATVARGKRAAAELFG